MNLFVKNGRSPVGSEAVRSSKVPALRWLIWFRAVLVDYWDIHTCQHSRWKIAKPQIIVLLSKELFSRPAIHVNNCHWEMESSIHEKSRNHRFSWIVSLCYGRCFATQCHHAQSRTSERGEMQESVC